MREARRTDDADAAPPDHSAARALVEAELRLVGRAEQLERERAELARARAELERDRERMEAERAGLEQYSAMAAHEVLRAVIVSGHCAGRIYERARHSLDLDSRQDLDRLARLSARVRLLVEALLLDARDSARPLRRQLVDLQAVVDDCAGPLAPELAARGAHVDVGTLPVVRGNAALLSGVFANLLSNALEHGPQRGGEIRVSGTREAGWWLFAVESSGTPIPDAERRALFQPWRQGHSERAGEGSGLGLAIVQRIVERHGGRVGVTSPRESVNRFFFTLPA